MNYVFYHNSSIEVHVKQRNVTRMHELHNLSSFQNTLEVQMGVWAPGMSQQLTGSCPPGAAPGLHSLSIL